MSILIKGMEMPSNCDECKLRNGMGKDDGKAIYHCAPLEKWVVPNPLAETTVCPLVEVPPHGRLIDADAPIPLVDTHGKNIEVTIAHIIEENFGVVNAIIEAEEGE